jgi:hypothetical protein
LADVEPTELWRFIKLAVEYLGKIASVGAKANALEVVKLVLSFTLS